MVDLEYDVMCATLKDGEKEIKLSHRGYFYGRRARQNGLPQRTLPSTILKKKCHHFYHYSVLIISN